MAPRPNSAWFRATTTAAALVVAVFGVITACHLQTASPTHPTVQAAFVQVALATTVAAAPAVQDTSYPPGCGPGGNGGNGGWFGSPGESGQAAQNGHCGKNGANGTNGTAPVALPLFAVFVLVMVPGLLLILRKRSRKNRAARANPSA